MIFILQSFFGPVVEQQQSPATGAALQYNDLSKLTYLN